MFLMTKKGFGVLKNFTDEFDLSNVNCVISYRDINVEKDYYDDIKNLCKERKINFCDKDDSYNLKDKNIFVIGWRWMIYGEDKFFVFHDSLLPKYRGFSPVVAQLINKEEKLGVTCLYASGEFDKGEVVEQKSISIEYPITISEAIDKTSSLYWSIFKNVYSKLLDGTEIATSKQNEDEATYSLWRDELDYKIDWTKDSSYIRRFIDSVGYPYKGALTSIEGKIIRVLDAEEYPDCRIENRNYGKIIFLKEGSPVVVCGNGLLKITKAVYEDTKQSILPLKNFRIRFS